MPLPTQERATLAAGRYDVIYNKRTGHGAAINRVDGLAKDDLLSV